MGKTLSSQLQPSTHLVVLCDEDAQWRQQRLSRGGAATEGIPVGGGRPGAPVGIAGGAPTLRRSPHRSATAVGEAPLPGVDTAAATTAAAAAGVGGGGGPGARRPLRAQLAAAAPPLSAALPAGGPSTSAAAAADATAALEGASPRRVLQRGALRGGARAYDTGALFGDGTG